MKIATALIFGPLVVCGTMGEAAKMNKLFTQFGNPPADRSRQMMRASDALENIRHAKINSDIVQQKGCCIHINQFWAYRP